jgi:hypothetical protein
MKASSALAAISTALIASQSINNDVDAFTSITRNRKVVNPQSNGDNAPKLTRTTQSMDTAPEKTSTTLHAISGAELQAAASLLGHATLGVGATLGAFRISEKIDAATDNPIARTAGELLTAVPIILTLNLLQNDFSQLQAVSDPLVKHMDAWEAQETISHAADLTKSTLSLH